ncbi:Ferrienterobactin-binding periplasmic protein precursor [Raoultella terrigena]|uniref:Ferrienterobactin-binding periplasmic protein n=1 Tax=Raoultella terrigena TaxID=577 RepID=A0A4U9DFJ5_RAOTE|nr:Ferrienterobactin-binding periplasmic protein precursor [Raoultella terrigena]
MARERKLARLYIGEPSAEAVAAQMPDLILISATGGDSALALYDQLSTIAPTLIINYDDKSWQALAHPARRDYRPGEAGRGAPLPNLISSWRR